MRNVNIRELHEHTGALVDLAAEGHVVVVMKRGTPIAELHPAASKRRQRTLPDRGTILRRFPQLCSDSGRFLEEHRS